MAELGGAAAEALETRDVLWKRRRGSLTAVELLFNAI